MSERAKLLASYNEWRRLTEAEGEAIQNGDWVKVTLCQDAKLRLQPEITRASSVTQREWREQGGDPEVLQHELRPIIGELIVMESRNGELLARRREMVTARKMELSRSTSNMRRIRNSYGGLAPNYHALERAV